MVQPLRIAVAEDERDTREYLQALLARLGHQAVAVGTGRQLVELCAASSPDLVLTDIRMPDMDGIEAAAVINHERAIPVVLISAYHDTELLDRAAAGNVMAYLVKPVGQADVEAAVGLAMHRFGQYQAARQEARGLKHALEDRKLVERAKGIVMKRLGVDEPEAFRRLKRMASVQNRKLAEVSREVLAADEVYQHLEGDRG
jgi:response regulator NasT